MKVHFIAMGGAVMHNLALSLRKNNYNVSGSDDEIFEPAYTNLKKANLLPQAMGWFPEKISADIDAVILGMHARADNPELLKAKEFNLKIYSFPAYVYEQTKNKQRVVIGGSHGKTSVTSMIMHVLNDTQKPFDYLVGSKIDGFELMVSFADQSPVAVIEGDEYLSSALEPFPKFHVYKPHVAVLTGIAWDHINVFPTFENYVHQFEIFINTIEPNGTLIYCEEDEHLRKLATIARKDIQLVPYAAVPYKIENEKTVLLYNGNEYPLAIFGKHNMMNLNAAWQVCKAIGVEDDFFLKSIQQFKGAAKRLELVAENDSTVIYKDFAHSPSKLKATVDAVKEMYPKRKVIACMELHTFSSLNKKFLSEYKGSMEKADIPVVFYNTHTIEMKKLENISLEEVKTAFDEERLLIVNDKNVLADFLYNQDYNNAVLLMMSSGNFEGLDWKVLERNVLK
jgi:UDP-N-acetylmuramate: L-alanyl-gamma-D-glutamyl-meso-diaminopimelate ligase